VLIEDVKRMASPLDRFLYYIAERWQIRQKRLQGLPPPWTIDEVLASYRFCNIRRSDDKVTRWLLDHWYRPNRSHTNLLLACALARYINLPTTLALIGFPHGWYPERIKEAARDIAKRDLPVFSVAYGTFGGSAKDGERIEVIVDQFLTPLVKHPPAIDLTSMRRSHIALNRYYGFGSHGGTMSKGFLAGQVIADMRLTLDALDCWRDRSIWSPISRGAQRSMEILYGPFSKSSIGGPSKIDNVLEFGERLHDLIAKVRVKIPTTVTDDMEPVDYEHCLNMFDRYESALGGNIIRHKYVYPTQRGSSRYKNLSPGKRD
jgi:alpha-glutamyl/putrescinyl thymine pyrophosphorylase clade 1